METQTHREPFPNPTFGEPVRARSTLICLAAAIALGLVSLAGAPTVRRQFMSMDPNSVSPEQRDHRARVMDGALIAQRRGQVVKQAFDQMYRRPDAIPNIERLTELDSENGLYQHLLLLSQLRQSNATTQPGLWERVQGAVRASEQAPPVRLYHRTMEDQVDDSLVRAGVDPRDAAALAQRTVSEFLREQHRPVIRELADRLLRLADELRANGQLDEARRVDLLTARILLEIVSESPTYDVALLSAERLPRALDGIARTASQRKDETTAAQARAAAQAVAAFPRDWRDDARDEDINVLPFSGGIVANLAYSAQRSLLGTFTRSLALVAFYILLWAAVLPLALIWAVSPSARAVPLTWRGRLGPALGCLIALFPLMVLLGVTFVGRLSFTWIFTVKSGQALMTFLLCCPLAIAVAARVAIRFPDPQERYRVPMSAVWIGLAFFMLLPIASYFTFALIRSVREPPVLVQYFRDELQLVGVISLVLTVIWFIFGLIQRLRGGIPRGLIARSQLAVLAQALLIVAVIMPLMLLANTRRDAGHQDEYAAASRKVIASQLSPTWQLRYFGAAQALIQSDAPALSR